ncbi:MAG: NAD(+)/NADH kinase [Polyangiaceae bacterium]|nr:NAD(+)/NADH kinase [Polyangiaceae bacterium]
MKPRPRVGLVVKRSVWQLDVQGGRRPQIRHLVKKDDPTVARLLSSHEEHVGAVDEVKAALKKAKAVVTPLGRHGEGFDPDAFDLVITVGGDGTLLSASHAVFRVPMLGINSAPSHSVGFFCGAKKGQAEAAILEAVRGDLHKMVLSRMAVRVNGKVVTTRVLNEVLYCHASPAATTRYILRLGDIEEEQKSSGFWMGPAAGSTAAQRSAGGRILPLSSQKLQLVVREPYVPSGSKFRLLRTLVSPGQVLSVRTKMHDARVYIDGPDTVANLNFGDTVELFRSDDSLTLLGLGKRRR